MLYSVNIASTAIKEISQVSVARQRGVRLARQLGFDEETLGKVALVVSEAASNVLAHGDGNGEILMSASEHRGDGSLHIMVTDQGPGIIKLGQALAGGLSTNSGLGEGLGAIRRLSDQFEIYAPPGGGTTIYCSLRRTPKAQAEARRSEQVEVGAVMRPKRGERQCGDTWAYRPFGPDSGIAMVVDGVGHGSAASEAAERALKTLADFRKPDVVALMREIHDRLSGTRGAAAVAVHVDPTASTLSACGIGNVAATLNIAGDRRGIVSLNGTLGHGEVGLTEFNYPWPEGALLVLNSDGVSSRWDLRDYPGLRLRHPALIAAILYRDHAYDRDDATVFVLRRPRQTH